MPVEPQPLSDDLSKEDDFHHPLDSKHHVEWETWEEETELNPVEEEK